MPGQSDATIGYDSDPRYGISSIAYSKGENALATFGYSRDNSELPVSFSELAGDWSFGYNNDGRLVTANPPAPVPDQPAGGSYVYDWIGNRLSPPADPNQMEYNKADQLLTWPGMYSYTYYADGSLRDAQNASGTSVLRSYTYWPSGLLNTASYSGRRCESTWDAAGNRVGLEIGGGEYSFVYDRIAGIPAVLEEDGTGGVKVYYFRTPGGAIIASRAGGPDQNSVPGSWRYYHYDELGSTRVLTDGDGDVTDTYSYDPYGNLIAHEGTTQQPYQWCGAAGYYTHYQDPEFRLIEMGYRFYDPEVGRFTQLDPIGDGLNWYEYCGGNPLGGIDPWGLQPCPVSAYSSNDAMMNDLWSSLFDGRAVKAWWEDSETQATANDFVDLGVESGEALLSFVAPYDKLLDSVKWPVGGVPRVTWANRAKVCRYMSKIRVRLPGTPGPAKWAIVKEGAKNAVMIWNIDELVWSIREAAMRHPRAGQYLWPIGPIRAWD